MKVFMQFVLIGVMLVLAPVMSTFAEDNQSLVLVADARSTLPSLTLRELRKAYLGVPVIKNELQVQPLINLTDELLYEIFLQKVMHMSSQSYQRQLVTRFLHAKGNRPPVYRDQKTLFDALAKDPGAITYIMWAEDAKKHTNLKIITMLWDGKS